ncbi:MAG: DUF1292 domain-containing protein [Lachnospiraceae bacterium]|nr:DUF1292 domain-containing protein [Robinsoniella sp.]MDY3766174.1 DUF1292 domain-containing protein [Lachnospiraceae bacterium]
MEKIKFALEGYEEEVEFYVLEQTRISGRDYLLVTEDDEDAEDAEALILRDLSKDGDAEALYEIVEDEEELRALSKVFMEMMDDIEIEL